MIHTHRFHAHDLLSITIAPTGKLGVHFLNWCISPKNPRNRNADERSFMGCGLYGVCFRGRLIYVGSYCGQKPKGHKGAYFSGDVVKFRWWQHIGSMTGRTHKLHVSKKVLFNLHKTFNHPMLASLAQAGPEIHKDAGCLGAENRLLFSIMNWNRFSTVSADQALKQFTFIYAQIDEPNLIYQLSPIELKKRIEKAEHEAIEKLQPEANTARRHQKSDACKISSRNALAKLSDILAYYLRTPSYATQYFNVQN